MVGTSACVVRAVVELTAVVLAVEVTRSVAAEAVVERGFEVLDVVVPSTAPLVGGKAVWGGTTRWAWWTGKARTTAAPATVPATIRRLRFIL